jgi:hypothetical protein
MAEYHCEYCGDNYDIPPGHVCWMAQHFSTQEVLDQASSDFLEMGKEPEDVKIPERVRKVDISNF